jgi:hypothetical protein
MYIYSYMCSSLDEAPYSRTVARNTVNVKTVNYGWLFGTYLGGVRSNSYAYLPYFNGVTIPRLSLSLLLFLCRDCLITEYHIPTNALTMYNNIFV